jgi:hypothetical protein
VRDSAGSGSGWFKILDDTPVLAVDSARYCIGATWMLRVVNGVTKTPIRLLGTSNGQSWEIQGWRKSDGDGNAGWSICCRNGGQPLFEGRNQWNALQGCFVCSFQVWTLMVIFIVGHSSRIEEI